MPQPMPAGVPTPPGRGEDATLLAVAVIWGASFAVVKDAYRAIPAPAFLAARFALVALSLLPLLASWRSRLGAAREAWRGILWVGLLGVAGYQLLFALGLEHTGAAQSTLLTSTSPLFTGLAAAILGLRPPTPWQWGGMVLALAGVTLLVGGPATGSPALGPGAGEWLSLGAAACAGAAFALAERHLATTDLAAAMSLALLLGSLAVVAGTWPALATVEWTRVPPRAWLELLYAAWVAGTAGYLLWYRALARVGAARGAVYGFLIPLVGVLAAVVGLGERLGPAQALGAGLVLAGVGAARYGPALGSWRRVWRPFPGK